RAHSGGWCEIRASGVEATPPATGVALPRDRGAAPEVLLDADRRPVTLAILGRDDRIPARSCLSRFLGKLERRTCAEDQQVDACLGRLLAGASQLIAAPEDHLAVNRRRLELSVQSDDGPAVLFTAVRRHLGRRFRRQREIDGRVELTLVAAPQENFARQ